LAHEVIFSEQGEGAEGEMSGGSGQSSKKAKAGNEKTSYIKLRYARYAVRSTQTFYPRRKK
jgi:hypothetical protein